MDWRQRSNTKTTKRKAVAGDNGFAIIHVPKSWAGKRCWVLNQQAYDYLRNKTKK